MLNIGLAQLLGLTMGLSIAGGVFVNRALDGLQHALPNESRGQLLSAITGTSGDLLRFLSVADQIVAADTLTIALRKVLVCSRSGHSCCVLTAIDLYWYMWLQQWAL